MEESVFLSFLVAVFKYRLLKILRYVMIKKNWRIYLVLFLKGYRLFFC